VSAAGQGRAGRDCAGDSASEKVRARGPERRTGDDTNRGQRSCIPSASIARMSFMLMINLQTRHNTSCSVTREREEREG
jgi:hypothetical protein